MVEKFNLVYIVDDDEIIIHLTDKLLNKISFSEKVKTFSNSSYALENLKESHITGEEVPDVILLDINMPEINGWQFLSEMKRLKMKVPVIIFTSSIDPADKLKANSIALVKGFITKPLTRMCLDKIRRVASDLSIKEPIV